MDLLCAALWGQGERFGHGVILLLECIVVKRPRIGITLDSEPAGGWSAAPWYALRQNYAAAVARAEGLPLLLPHHPADVPELLELLDGVVVSGGHFDVDPSLFSATARHETVATKPERTEFELALLQGALDRDLPLFAICGGEQLLNVALGGTLIQHIPDEVPQALLHEQNNPKDEAAHEVSLVPGTLLQRLLGQRTIAVNSTHHQAVAEVGRDLTTCARAPDGVIEAIERRGARFCLGVQWHPEYDVGGYGAPLFEAFVQACR